MGLIVTLYLMLINTFTSVNAPKTRGFSYIEMWFVGVQIPIVWALLEYGIILAVIRNKDNSPKIKLGNKQYYLKNMISVMDQICFVISIIYFCGFNYFYWNMGLNEWYQSRQIVLGEEWNTFARWPNIDFEINWKRFASSNLIVLEYLPMLLNYAKFREKVLILQ